MPNPQVFRTPAMYIVQKDAEVRLVDMLASIREDKENWRAVYFHFSRLLEHYRSEYQTKIVVNLIYDLLKMYSGGIFVCQDGDLILLCRDATPNLLDKATFQLRYLLVDDPLAYHEDGRENEEFCTAYALKSQWAELLALCKKRVAMLNKPAVLPVERKKAASAGEGKPRVRAFTSGELVHVERDLQDADISRAFRRQSVCAAQRDTPVRKIFDELYIHIPHLRQLLKADVDMLSDRWLFKYLTQILDGRMLDLLRHHPSRYLDLPISLNLNVSTLLSEKFSVFDASLKPETKVSVVIELQVADVFADMAGFLAAKNHVQSLGYRVCLDGLTTLSFPQIDRERLGFDLAKVQWNADAERDLQSAENQKLAVAIRNCGANRVILCRCDTRAAVQYGQALGVSLFQGRYLDSLMNPSGKQEN